MKATPQESIFARAKRLMNIKTPNSGPAPTKPDGANSPSSAIPAATPPLASVPTSLSPRESIFARAAALIQSQQHGTAAPAAPHSLLPIHPPTQQNLPQQPALSLLSRYQATIDPQQKADLLGQIIQKRENCASQSRAAIVAEWENETDPSRKLAIRNRLMSADLAA